MKKKNILVLIAILGCSLFATPNRYVADKRCTCPGKKVTVCPMQKAANTLRQAQSDKISMDDDAEIFPVIKYMGWI